MLIGDGFALILELAFFVCLVFGLGRGFLTLAFRPVIQGCVFLRASGHRFGQIVQALQIAGERVVFLSFPVDDLLGGIGVEPFATGGEV